MQGQIDKLATKEDLSAQLGTLQTALDAAAKDAKDAVAKATEAEKAAKAASDAAKAAGDAAAEAKAAADAAKAAADKAAAEAEAKAIEAAKAEVEKAKADLEKLVADGLAENKEAMDAMREEVAAAKKQVEEAIGKVADMVTSVELLISDYVWNNPVLRFSSIVEKENVFQEGIANPITFTENAQKQRAAKVLVRVSPTNAVLTPDMISFVNSKGENLNESLQVVKVEPYKELLTRAVTSNGLWEVSVALKNYNEDAFKAIQLKDPTKPAYKKVTDSEGHSHWVSTQNTIVYAVQVNNTLSTAENRYVTSAYNLSLDWSEFRPEGWLDFVVDGRNSDELANRARNWGTTFENGSNPGEVSKEYVWNGEPAVKAITEGTNMNVIEGDSYRVTKEVLNVIQGKPITISLGRLWSDGTFNPLEGARAMYVVLDKDNAIESAPSELNAWNSYTYTGLNKVVEGTTTQITINASSAINDIIGFRVFAVNHDGTLIDPDGKAFYVRVGDVATEWSAANTVIVPDAFESTTPSQEKSNKVEVNLSKLSGVDRVTFEMDDKDAPAFDVKFVNKNGKTEYTAYELVNAKLEEISKVYTIPTAGDWTAYEDDKTYTGTLKVYNDKNFVLATLKVSMTKQLPTTVPSGFSIKDKQVINGIYNCFMIADTWEAPNAVTGSMPIENLINFGKGNPAQYVVAFAESTIDENKKPAAVVALGDGQVVVDKKYIDNKTEHATQVVYNYGQVSSKKDAQGKFVSVTVPAAEFKTVYNCFYKPEVHTWAWATRENLGLTAKNDDGSYAKPMPYSTTLTYGKDVKEAYNQYVFGKNAIDGEFSKALNKVYENSLIVKNAKLISDATQKEDYFEVTKELQFKAIKIELGSNPKANVPSTLIINCKDSYGHDVVIKLPMTVAPRK